MAEILAIRYGGGYRGEDVVEPLLGPNLAVLLERGRVELDATADDLQEVTVNALFRPNVFLGQLIYSDDSIGAPILGKVVGIRHRFDGKTTLTELTLLRREVTDE